MGEENKGGLKMKKIFSTIFFSALALSFLSQSAIGKSIKGPNVSAIYRIEAIASELPALSDKQGVLTQNPLPEAVQTSFQRLFGINKDLALEAGRLPAFQKDVKEKVSLALTRFTELVYKATPEEKTNLALLLKIGLQESRRYSTPLEAIFWVLERDDYDRNKQVLQFSLEVLLDKAWVFSDRAKWGDYETVTDRLNAPELVNYYQRILLVYESKKGKRESSVGDARGLFVKKVGNCYDHSYFAAYCLEKAGYKTSIVGVHPSRPSFHVVCQFEVDGKSYYIDNGRTDKFLRRGIIPKAEYDMYHERENLKKGKATKDPVYLLQDNHGLALIYLMEREEKVTSIKALSDALGISGYAGKVKSEYIPALIKNGFITKPVPRKDKGPEDFEYTINESLCARFKAERYHRPQNAAAKW
jgi:hypothetical protein